MSNVGALDQIRTFLRQHPHLHDQSMWTCGTTACVAGWVVALDKGSQPGSNVTDDLWACNLGASRIAARAQELLGLAKPEASALFLDAQTEIDALLLIDALIARDKGELCDADREVLRRNGLPEEPAGDAA